jgi:hypothetical protein
MTTTKKSAYEQYTQTSYSGTHLLQKHKLSDIGLWRIRGEDSNCDFGGSHYQPDLGVVEGSLRDVIEYAVGLKSFWTWGGGGDIELVSVKKIDPLANLRIAELRKEARDLEDRLKTINTELKVLA